MCHFDMNVLFLTVCCPGCVVMSVVLSRTLETVLFSAGLCNLKGCKPQHLHHMLSVRSVLFVVVSA